MRLIDGRATVRRHRCGTTECERIGIGRRAKLRDQADRAGTERARERTEGQNRRSGDERLDRRRGRSLDGEIRVDHGRAECQVERVGRIRGDGRATKGLRTGSRPTHGAGGTKRARHAWNGDRSSCRRRPRGSRVRGELSRQHDSARIASDHVGAGEREDLRLTHRDGLRRGVLAPRAVRRNQSVDRGRAGADGDELIRRARAHGHVAWVDERLRCVATDGRLEIDRVSRADWGIGTGQRNGDALRDEHLHRR